MFTGQIQESQSKGFHRRRLSRSLSMLLLVAVLGLLGLIARPAVAADLCSKGCKLTTKRGCKISATVGHKGCMFECKTTFLESGMQAEDRDALDACMVGCEADLESDKAACEAAQVACQATCDSNTACGSSCGSTLFTQAKIVIVATKQCIGACADGDGACLLACTKPGDISAHLGQAALQDIYLNPSSGFAACMSNSLCTSPDADADGIFEDGDNSGIKGDNPCTGGNTVGCDDNCAFANSSQADTDSDGTGDSCDYNCTVANGALVEGGVYLDSVAPANAVPGSSVSACKTGCCTHTESDANGAFHFPNLDAGTYQLYSSAPGNALSGTLGPLSVNAGNTYSNQNLVNLTPAAPAADTSIGNDPAGQIPSVSTTNDESVTTTGCSNGTGSWSVAQPGNPLAPNPLASGTLVETPVGSGTYIGTIPGGTFQSGSANEITISIDCPNPADNETSVFDVYIDPSGFTRFLNGSPAIGATVTLLRSDTPIGPFTVVPDGSAIMSPKNRRNPDLSDTTGHFGWDVIPGYYLVHAEIAGCVTESAVLEIPPPVTDLDLVFTCPCGAGPQSMCKTAGKGQLTIADNPSDDSKDSFSWKWSSGESTSLAEFGTPQSTTSYDVCVYTAGNTLLTAVSIPADAMSWQASGTDGSKGFKYADSDGLNGGLRKVALKTSQDNKAVVDIKAKGIDLVDAALGNLATPIVVQLQRRDAAGCFESTFDASTVMNNDNAKLKVRK